MARTEYTSVCDRCGRGTWYEGGRPCGMSYPTRCECCGHLREDKYSRCTGTLRAVDTSDLASQFARYYQSGERIRVQWYGETITGTVSKTTGWRPAYLLMPRSDSTGSPYILKPEHRVLAVKRGDRYVSI